jgi:preprotein translocase subunit SecE
MAVAEARKMDKGDGGGSAPAWLSGALGWGPQKLRDLRTFFSEVKSELKKVTWPGRSEVYGTTIVVLLTTLFFGFYLFGADMIFSWIMSHILR